MIGEAADLVVVDDYGHNPAKIQATLAAARARYPDRDLWAVWQPHTYSRTQTFNGARWLMIRVTSALVLEDVKKLIRLRVPPKGNV